MKKNKFSVIVPIYKTHHFLKRLLASIPNKECVEIIFIDDSPEVDLNFISKVVNESNRVNAVKILKNNKNMGVTFSRNKGYHNMSGEYAIFLDSDDYFSENALDIIEECVDRNNSDIYLFRVMDPNNNIIGEDKDCELSFNGIDSLSNIYGIGECLVVVKKAKHISPFVGFLRGHELFGLTRYLSKTDSRSVFISNHAVRYYCFDNEHSVSNSANFGRRLKSISLGHYLLAKVLINNGKVYLGIKWLSKSFVRLLQFYFYK